MEDHLPLPSTTETFEGHFDDLAELETVAIISQPWGGRMSLLDHVEGYLGASATHLNPSHPDDDVSIPERGLVFVEDCHHLYHRKIGGYDAVDALTHEIAGSRATVFTSWNTYAWSYITQATDIDGVFDLVFEIPPLTTGQAAVLLRNAIDAENPEEQLEAYAENAPINTEDRLKLWRHKLRRFYRGSSLAGYLEGLVSDAGGNPRAVRRLYEQRVEKAVDGRPGGFDLTYDESYLLWLVLSNETVRMETLAEITGNEVDIALGKLARQDAITIDTGTVSIRPEAFGDVVSHLTRRRLIW